MTSIADQFAPELTAQLDKLRATHAAKRAKLQNELNALDEALAADRSKTQTVHAARVRDAEREFAARCVKALSPALKAYSDAGTRDAARQLYAVYSGLANEGPGVGERLLYLMVGQHVADAPSIVNTFGAHTNVASYAGCSSAPLDRARSALSFESALREVEAQIADRAADNMREPQQVSDVCKRRFAARLAGDTEAEDRLYAVKS